MAIFLWLLYLFNVGKIITMETKLLEGQKAIELGAELIKAGEVVVFPTETVYGLGADAFNVDAVKKIYLAKGRPSDNPLIVHIYSKDQIKDLVSYISDDANLLIDTFMPGPITIIMPKAPSIPKEVTGGLDTVGIRMPSHKVANAFLRACNCPIAAPSANVSTHISPTNAEDVYEDMQGRVPLIIQGGPSDVGIESTIVDMTQSIPTILRPGGITQEMIANVLGACESFKGKVTIAKAPGMKYKHYAPSCTMVIANSFESMIQEYEKVKMDGMNPIIIARDDVIKKLTGQRYIDVGLDADETMRNIFASMHEGQRIADYIICQDFGQDGKNASVMNRVNKAAGGVRV